MSILDELIIVFKSLNMKVKIILRVFEGKDNYAETSTTIPH